MNCSMIAVARKKKDRCYYYQFIEIVCEFCAPLFLLVNNTGGREKAGRSYSRSVFVLVTEFGARHALFGTDLRRKMRFDDI